MDEYTHYMDGRKLEQITYPLKELVVSVCPWIVNLDNQRAGVEDDESVVDVGTQGRVDVLRYIFALAGSVPGPVREI